MRTSSGLDRFRESLRLQQVFNTFVRYGLDALLDRGLIGDFRRFRQGWVYDPPQPLVPLSTPVKVRLMIGGFFHSDPHPPRDLRVVSESY